MSNPQKLRVSRIRIQNILGIEFLEFEPGNVNVITGSNGQGKTSLLEALRAVNSDAHDATLLRLGADRGELVLVLDDETEIRRRIYSDESRTEVRMAHGKVSRPVGFVRSLFDNVGLNPVSFLTAKPKERADILLSCLHLEVSSEEIAAAAGHEVPNFPAGTHALACIAAASKSLFDERTFHNREVKQREGSIAQLCESLPVDEETDWAARLTELQQHSGSLAAQRQKELDRCDAQFRDLKASSQEAFNARERELREEFARKLEELQRDREAAQRVAADGHRAGREEIQARYGPQHEEMAGQLAEARTRAEQARQTAKLKSLIETQKQERDRHTHAAEQLTVGIQNLEALKRRLLSTLPVPGLQISGQGIFVDDIPYDRLNYAQRVDIAMQVAMARPQKLGLVCVDGLECLDSEHFAALKEAMDRYAGEHGLQFFVTRVSDGPLEIQTTAHVA